MLALPLDPDVLVVKVDKSDVLDDLLALLLLYTLEDRRCTSGSRGTKNMLLNVNSHTHVQGFTELLANIIHVSNGNEQFVKVLYQLPSRC